MSVFLTSDTHFNHDNMAFGFGEHSRHFNTVQEMNEKIIENWNNIVRPDDIIYHLGDVAFGSIDDMLPIIPRLNGNVILVHGNHDGKKKRAALANLGWDVIHNAVIEKDGIQFYLRHIPNRDFKGDKKNVMLYGHLHDAAPKGLREDYSYHVGLDTNDLMPVNLDDIINDIKEGNIVRD